MMTDIFPTAFSIGDGMPVRRGKPNRVIALPAHFQPQHLPILTRSTNQSMRHIFTPTRRHWNNWGTRACYWMDLDGILPNRENPVNLESPRHPTTIVMDGPEEKERLSDLIKSWQLTRHMRSMYPTQTTLGMELCLWGYTLAQLQRQDILHTFSQKNIVIYEHCMNRKKFTKTASSRSQCKDLMGWVSTRVTKFCAKSHTKKSENFSQFFFENYPPGILEILPKYSCFDS